jgi:hypothetical protein
MIAAIILGSALCFLEPGFTLFLQRAEALIPLEPPFLAWLPLSVAMVLTAALIGVNYAIHTIRHRYCLSQKYQSQSRSER